MKRVAMTTVTFRARFAQTRIKNHPPVGELMLIDVPEYYADRFKVHHLEFWSRHFESRDPDYLKRLARRIRRAKSTLINIQIDEPYNLSSTDEEGRQKSLAFVKGWIDTAVSLGAKSARANTGRGDIEACIRSFKEIDRYSKEKGILLLTENHGGLSSDPDMLLRLVEAVGGDNFEILPDFGNFNANVQMEGLRKILPFAKHLISAKAMQFDDKFQHTAYDFDRCVRLSESMGFAGYYSAEYYDGRGRPVDYEKVADWMLEHIKANLKA
jgi:sugar phosphate isomerase/epimerase